MTSAESSAAAIVLADVPVEAQLRAFTGELDALLAVERHRPVAPGERDERWELVRSLAFVVEAKDSYTRDHLDRTYAMAVALARLVAPELADDRVLGYGFLLHDVGKVGVPKSVLCKPGPLTEDEWEVMRAHPEIGARVVAPMSFLAPALDVIRSHHERWDGAGYPDGARGGAIPLAARLFSIVDSFDAMCSDRPYRRALSPVVALERLRAEAGRQFDPRLVAAFVALHDSGALDSDWADGARSA